MDKITNDARVYTDVQGLEQLRGQYKTNPAAVKKEMAIQFESLLIQMVLRSMRDANNAYSSGLFSSSDISMYQDMFDKQLSLALSSRGMGFAQIIEANIDQQSGVTPSVENQKLPALPVKKIEPPVNYAQLKSELNSVLTPAAEFKGTIKTTEPPKEPVAVKESVAIKEPVTTTAAKGHDIKSPRDFMKLLWSGAKRAASLIGVPPSVLVAQAALETDWGRKIIAHASGNSSYNLFNIKSDASWHKNTTTAATLEQKEGVIVKERANFRSYASFEESFEDYVKLIKFNSRYQKAIENAHEPATYTQALQEAGYASDQHYASKIMGILKSPHFQSLLAEMQ